MVNALNTEVQTDIGARQHHSPNFQLPLGYAHPTVRQKQVILKLFSSNLIIFVTKCFTAKILIKAKQKHFFFFHARFYHFG